MTPVGHASIGYLLATRSPRICVTAMVAGTLAPDIDFLLLGSAAFNELHRTATHSLLFVTLAGALAFLVAPAARRRTVSLSFVLGGLTHLIIDACLDRNPSNGLGVAFLWPFVPEPIPLVNILEPTANALGWSEPIRMLPDVGLMLVFEAPLAMVALLVWLRRRSARENRDLCKEG